MRAIAIMLLMLLGSTSCGPSSAHVRMNRVATTRADAQARAGARQALAYAEAVHTAYAAGDYKATPLVLAADTVDAIRVLDRATPNAGGDAPTLVAWRAQMFLDGGKIAEARDEFRRSWELGPNTRAGYVLVGYHGSRNEPERVSHYCNEMIGLMDTVGERMQLIQTCRTNMNAATPEGEMAWMSPKLIEWYQTENARQLQAQIEYRQAVDQQQREDNRIVRRTEQCALSCKERGLGCQNRCDGDAACDNRCVQINHACVDRCGAAAMEELGE